MILEIAVLLTRFNFISQKDDGSEIAALIKRSFAIKQNKCDVIYDSKCFQIVAYETGNVTFTDVEPTCKSKNIGKLANIHDLAHYKLLVSYIRSLIPAGRSDIYIWTGMEYKNNKLLLNDGRPYTIATNVWYPGHPSSAAPRTSVAIYLRKDPGYAYQGMFSEHPSWTKHGVICEM
uniref:uncharacterized protein LOC120340387 n=1 Tax=Styela clava TaxID=7725 RepID=UPI00193A0980|nr:uncharacterized protein LOC120340387 [Styela clava]